MLLELAMALIIQDSRTICREFGGQVTCDTTRQQTGMDAYNAAREASARQTRPATRADDMACAGGDWWMVDCSLGAHREAVRLRDARRQAEAGRAQAMDHLRAGDCQAAVNAALGTNDLEFATQVRSFCAATPPPQ